MPRTGVTGGQRSVNKESAMQTSAVDSDVRSIMREVTENLTRNLRDALAAALEKQLTESLTQALLESEFYRKISTDMRDGLRRIYKEMNEARSAGSGDVHISDKAEADKLFKDASEQLSAVLRQTEDAANTIMEVVEHLQERQQENTMLLEKAHKGMITPAEWQKVIESNKSLGEDLTTLMTAMSFQDLTGQRIKKAVAAMKQLESTVLELYLSSGVMMKAYEEKPGQDMDRIEEQARAAVADLKQKVEGSELKGPSSDGCKQGDIDDLLAQFGL